MKKLFMIPVLIILFTGPVFAQNGVIRELAGTVELRRPRAANFIPARVSDIVTQDTVLFTGFRSSALVEIGSSLITVRPLTRLTLAEIESIAETETININMQTGRVRVNVSPPEGSRTFLYMQGPEVTASTRGTIFEFDTRVLAVFEGIIAFNSGRGGVLLISAGSTSQPAEDGTIPNPVESNAAELLPPPPAGSNFGFNRYNPAGGPFDPNLDFPINLILH